jgi:hypothetical protein
MIELIATAAAAASAFIFLMHVIEAYRAWTRLGARSKDALLVCEKDLMLP